MKTMRPVLPPTYSSPWLALYAIWAARRVRVTRIRKRRDRTKKQP